MSKCSLTRVFRLVFSLFAVAVVAACQAAGSYDAKLQTASATSEVARMSNAETLLVVLRYPALFDRRTGAWLNNLHAANPISLDPRPPSSPRNPDPFTNTLIKTNYYVMEFYEALKAKLPPHTVALQPQRLVMRGDRVEPVIENEMPPAVLYVDFATYVYPHKFLTGDSNTFGHYISPFIAVRTSPAAAIPTFGALVGTQGLRPSGVASAGDRAVDGEGYTLLDHLNDQGSSDPIKLPVVSEGPLNGKQYLELPQVNISMGAEAIQRAAAAPGGMNGSARPSDSVMNSLSAAVLQALNAVDHGVATRADFSSYLSFYDPALAGLFSRSAMTNADQGRMEFVRECIAIEREFLTDHDGKHVTSAYRGGFGDAVRQLLVAEAKHYSDFWGQQIMSSLFILGTGMASGSATGNYMPSSLWDIYFQSQESSAALNTAFEKHFLGVREEQATFTIDLSRGSVRIEANKLSDIRDQCRHAYRNEFRRLT